MAPSKTFIWSNSLQMGNCFGRLAQFEFTTSFLPDVMFDWDSQKDFLNADARVERCTSDMLFQPDYEQNLAVVDILNEKPSLYANSLPSMASPHPRIPDNSLLYASYFAEQRHSSLPSSAECQTRPKKLCSLCASLYVLHALFFTRSPAKDLPFCLNSSFHLLRRLHCIIEAPFWVI